LSRLGHKEENKSDKVFKLDGEKKRDEKRSVKSKENAPESPEKT